MAMSFRHRNRNKHHFSNVRSGRREDLGGRYYRSAWEANYARYLNWLMEKGVVKTWSYEPRTFWFDGVRRGVTSYKPDFMVSIGGGIEWHEVKGYMTARNHTALKRMAKYHPDQKVVVIDARKYRLLQSQVGMLVKGWE